MGSNCRTQTIRRSSTGLLTAVLFIAWAGAVRMATADEVVNNQPWTGPISGRVFQDVNNNGTWDAGDKPLKGVGVADTVDLVLTAEDGTYTLPNASKDARLVYISIPSGYAKTNRWYEQINADSPANKFDFPLQAAEEPKGFDFVQVTDVHVAAEGTRDLLIDGFERVAALKNRPAFVLATGDLVNQGKKTKELDLYVEAVATSKVPVFSVFGNHDANDGTPLNYRKYLGPDYYSFDYANAHFLIVNAIQKSDRQSAWIAKDLELLRGGKRLFIFQHFPPSGEEIERYASWQADGVFSGHWHSQHTVKAGKTVSYNTATTTFGGIDLSPAGFKVITVAPSGVTTKMRWIADGRRLQIVNPSHSLLVSQGDVSILANAYETSADIVSVTYQLSKDGAVVDKGTLSPQGQWSWTGSIPAARAPRGGYELQVASTNDRGETSTANTTFTVLGLHARPPRRLADWTQFGGGPQRGGKTSATLKPPLGQVWSYQTGGSIDFASPVLKDDTVYIGVKDRNDFAANGVLALKASNGEKLWFTPTPAAVSHSVAVDDERVYACSHGGIVHAFKRDTGKELWNQVLGSDTQRYQYGAPVIEGNRLFAGTFAFFGRFDMASGKPAWTQKYGGDWIACNACPAVSGNTVLAAANWQKESLKAINAANGETLWAYQGRGLHGSPVIVGDRVVFTDSRGQLHCAALADGKQRWTVELGGGSACTPAIAHDIVVAGGTGSISGFQLEDGKKIWDLPIGTSALKMDAYNTTFAALVGSPTIADRIAFVPCGDGKLYAIQLESGKMLWSTDFGTPILSAPCISGNWLFLSAFDGNVYALSGMGGYSVSAESN